MSSEPFRRLALPDGTELAYWAVEGRGPGVVFLGGFGSDMTGEKARALEAHCRARGRAFVRFDYFGHGASGGAFREGTVGRWAADAVAVLDALTRGPQVLVGSSLGGWLMVLAARARPERVEGLVGVAAAPDFSEDLLWARLDGASRERLERAGVLLVPNPYGEEPTVVTRALIEDGRRHLVLRGPIPIRCPVRLLHGLADPDVPWETSVRLARALASEDVTVTLVKGGGHRLSEPEDLTRLCAAVEELCGRGTGP
ncbi:MAG: alpha/beta hydrolase [Deferrisomatales bacterium]